MTNKELRTKQVHITFTEAEKKKIKKFARDSRKTTREFIRNAVFEKIRRLEYPEQFKQSNIEQIDPKTLEEIKKGIEESIELQKLTNERLTIAENIESIIQAINQEYNKLKKKSLIEDYSREADFIFELLENHKSLTPNQICKMANRELETNLDINDILLILNTDYRFKLNITTGRYELR